MHNTQTGWVAELTYQKKFGNLEVIPNINLPIPKSKSNCGDVNLNNEGLTGKASWSLLYNQIKITLWTDFNFQLNAQYESQEVIPQGKNKAELL